MCFRPPEMKPPKKCPECGARNPGMKTTCKKCGAPLPPTMIDCPHCGVPQPEDNKVCTNCGFNGKPGSGDPAKRKKVIKVDDEE